MVLQSFKVLHVSCCDMPSDHVHAFDHRRSPRGDYEDEGGDEGEDEGEGEGEGEGEEEGEEEEEEEEEDEDFNTARANLGRRGSYNSPRIVRRLGEILYPNFTPGQYNALPEGVDTLIFLTFRTSGALFPISRDLLVGAMALLAEFLDRRGGTQYMQTFLNEAQRQLSNHGWPSNQWEVRSTSSPCCLVVFNSTAAAQGKDLAWKLLFTAIGFNPRSIDPTLDSAPSFTAFADYYFPHTQSSTFSFTLADLQALGITIVPTHSIHEHLCLDGDKLKLFIVSGASGCELLAFRRNRVAK
jgi:hypothetical protein